MKRNANTMQLIVLSFFVLALATLGGGHAQAACGVPGGEKGDVIYNSSYKVLQYCNGTNWIAMHPYNTVNECFFPSGTCPASGGSHTGCISGRTLTWGTVSCSTNGDQYRIEFTDPLVEGLKPSGNNTASARSAAAYFCEEMGYGYYSSTVATLYEEGYWGPRPTNDSTGWFYRPSVSETRITDMICFLNVNAR